jgi:RNA polymerase sigma-70 factor (ECF subfamily)
MQTIMTGSAVKGSGDDRLPSTGTSRSLLERVRLDESAAWERLVGLYGPLVLHWCRQFELQEQDAADVFQNVFQAVATHLGTFRKGKETDTFRGWLRVITHNKVYDHFRLAGRQPGGIGGTEAQVRLNDVPARTTTDEMAGAEERAERQLFRRGLALIRAEFEDRTWQAFWRTAVDGLSAGEAGRELSMSPGAVRVAKSRVLQRLREELGDLE